MRTDEFISDLFPFKTFVIEFMSWIDSIGIGRQATLVDIITDFIFVEPFIFSFGVFSRIFEYSWFEFREFFIVHISNIHRPFYDTLIEGSFECFFIDSWSHRIASCEEKLSLISSYGLSYTSTFQIFDFSTIVEIIFPREWPTFFTNSRPLESEGYSCIFIRRWNPIFRVINQNNLYFLTGISPDSCCMISSVRSCTYSKIRIHRNGIIMCIIT